MNKKGFTLIEIIIVIALLAVVGTSTSVAVIKINDKKEKNILIENEEKFKNAIDVYLSNHSEVINNINNNAEGAVISLELLKNEGLISDKLNINYEENYYIVSNALLSNIKPSNLDGECKDSVSLEIIANWQHKNNSSEVLYFCPKKVVTSSSTITDPKVACEDGVLAQDTLTCQIIKNAKKAPDDYADDISELIEDESEEIGSKITNIGDDAYLTQIPENSPKYRLLSDISDEKQLIFNDSVCEFIPNIYIYKEENLKFNNVTGNFDIIAGKKEEKVIEGTGCSITFNGYARYTQDINELVDYIAEQDGLVFAATSDPSNIKRIYKNLKCIDRESKLCNGNSFKNDNNYYIVEFIEGEPITEKSIRKTEDDYGISYYYRGNVEDNYVTFSNMCWRTIRIQGDGSVKLVLASPNGPCNTDVLTYTSGILYDLGAWGRGTDNMLSCDTSGDEYCFSCHYQYSAMNRNLKKWINDNNIPKDSLKKEKFCIGQSDNEKNVVYDKVRSPSSYDPSLICEVIDGDETTIAEEVSLVTIDELVYSGVSKDDVESSSVKDHYNKNITTYFEDNAKDSWALLNPAFYTESSGKWVYSFVKRKLSYDSKIHLYGSERHGYIIDGYSKKGCGNYAINSTRPVIVLKPENYVDVSKNANGTLEKPYEIIIKN